MRQVIVLVVLAALAFGVWKFWPEIKGQADNLRGAAEKTPEKQPEKKTEKQPEKQPVVATGPTRPIPAPSEKSKPGPSPEPQPKLAKVNVDKLTAHLSLGSGAAPFLVVESNMPAGAVLEVVANDENQQPMFTDGPLLLQGFRYDVADELVFRLTYYPQRQSPEIQEVVGARGEALEGPFVQQVEGERVIRAFTKITPRKVRFSRTRRRIELPIIAAREELK